MTTNHAAVDAMLYVLDEAFEGNDEHSPLGNLRNVTPEDWLARPLEGSRTVCEIVDHDGAPKYAYRDYMFGAGTPAFDDALRSSPSRSDAGDIAGVTAWLRAGRAQLREEIAALTDDDLPTPRKAHWGMVAETRWLISVLIEHDIYHAGEINHLRAQRQGNDRWPEQAPQ